MKNEVPKKLYLMSLYASTSNPRNHSGKAFLKPADRPKRADSHSATIPWKHIGWRNETLPKKVKRLLEEHAIAIVCIDASDFLDRCLINIQTSG